MAADTGDPAGRTRTTLRKDACKRLKQQRNTAKQRRLQSQDAAREAALLRQTSNDGSQAAKEAARTLARSAARGSKDGSEAAAAHRRRGGVKCREAS